jgi:hypothetical protein
MKIPGVKSFVVEEFLHPTVFKYVNRSDDTERWRWYVSQFQIDFAVLVRKLSGAPLYLNTWHNGGRHVGRGHRPQYYRPRGGARLSQHYASKALDMVSGDNTTIQLFELILDNAKAFEGIGLTTIENPRITKRWLHGDCRERLKGIHPEKGFLIVGA